jgi:NAD-dependent deacetylase
MMELDEKIRKFADLIVEAKNVVVLTGAGMSTESGIADFRSPGTGLWEKVDPYEFGSVSSYVANTGKNLNFMLEVGRQIFGARPNKGHKALTKLQKIGKLRGILTQNIDGLHLRAKTKNVVELHGTALEAVCMRCKKIVPITIMVNQFLTGCSPSCEECNGLLKPNAIFFGEPLRSDVLRQADELLEGCDLFIVLGSSLIVYPVAFYPRKALSMGAKLAIINIQETDVDDDAVIGDILPRIVEIVEKRSLDNKKK